MAEPYLGEIRAFPYSYAPKGWVLCDGSLLKIAENPALFSLLGETFGGDGRITFGVPNLTGRITISDGQGAGLTPRRVGEMGGSTRVSLSGTHLPPHSHALRGTSSGGTQKTPADALFATVRGQNVYQEATGETGTMAGASLSPGGEGEPHENRMPGLELNYCIAIEGAYPSEESAPHKADAMTDAPDEAGSGA